MLRARQKQTDCGQSSMNTRKALLSIPCTTNKNNGELGMMLQACNPGTWKAKAGGLEIKDKPPLHRV